MDRHIRLDTIAEKLEALCRQDGPVSGQAAQVLSEAVDELHAFQRENLDFHEIVEHVDHSIFVTDGEGNVLYVNRTPTSSRRMFWAETYSISCRRAESSPGVPVAMSFRTGSESFGSPQPIRQTRP